jgi:hypothetical protein
VPEPIVPEPAPDGEIDHVTLWFAAPDTDAESCQFAPTPIGQGFVIDAAHDEFAMLTVTVCCWKDVFDRPHAASGRRASDKKIGRYQISRLEFRKRHLTSLRDWKHTRRKNVARAPLLRWHASIVLVNSVNALEIFNEPRGTARFIDIDIVCS